MEFVLRFFSMSSSPNVTKYQRTGNSSNKTVDTIKRADNLRKIMAFCNRNIFKKFNELSCTVCV